MKTFISTFFSLMIIHSAIGQSKPSLLGDGIVSKGAMEFNATLTEDNSTLYFTAGSPMWSTLAICSSKKENAEWVTPTLLPFSGKYLDADPFMLNDDTLYFASDRPITSDSPYQKWDYNIWYAARKGDAWTEPTYIDGAFNDLGMVLYPSLSKSKNLYFTARDGSKNCIYVSEYRNGTYQTPKKLSFVNPDYNYLDAIVSRDESFIIFTSNMDGGFGGMDLWISFNDGGEWQDPVNMGSIINSPGNEGQPGLSRNQKILFYSYGGSSSKSDINSYQDLYKHLQSAGNGFLDIYQVDLDITQFKND